MWMARRVTMAGEEKAHTLKQIRAWKVLLWNVLTLGLYSIVWTALRRSELPKPQPKITHWAWFVGLNTLGIFSLIILMVYALIFIDDAQTAVDTIVYGAYAISILMTLWCVWWAVMNVQAIHAALELKLPRSITIVTALFMYPALVVFEQVAINRSGQLSKHHNELRKKQVMTVIISLVIGVPAYIFSYTTYPTEQDMQQFKRDHTELRRDLNEIDTLSAEYDACLDKLNEDYPDDDAAAEHYDAYMKAYNACDEIYQKIQAL